MLMQSKSYFRKSMAENILSGLELGEFMVYYQPKLDLASRKIKSLEALARWHSSGIGWVPPSEFIPIAEASGSISALGEWILFSACEQTKNWQMNGFPELCVSVNLSPRQMEEKNITLRIEEILIQTRLKPQFLELEITESTFMEDSKRAMKVLKELKSIGVSLAIDDFGKGYSSIDYLTAFSFDCLKIDQAFARSIHLPKTQIVIRAITNLSRQLGLATVIEGIENETELVVAGHLGCDVVQGFGIRPPLPVDETSLVLASFRNGRHI